MTKYEWAMLMSETYAKQNDCEQSEYYYKMAQYFKKADKDKKLMFHVEHSGQ